MSDMAWLVGVFGLLALAGLVFWIWCLVDAIRVPDDSQYRSGNKLVWVLVIALTGWVGAVIYLAVGRPEGGAAKAIAERGALGPAGSASGSIPPPPPPPPPAPG